MDIYLAYHDLEEQDIERLQNIISYFEKKRLHPVDVGNEFASKIMVHIFQDPSTSVYLDKAKVLKMPKNV